MCQLVKCHITGCNSLSPCYINNVNNHPLTKMYFDPTMTLEEYEDYKLRDEINIGYEVEEDFPEEYEDDSYIDDLQTDGFNAVYDPLDELFGEPIAGYSLY